MSNTPLKPWAENYPSPYEGHDLTHRPDWHNVIVLDAFFNNLTSGFMVITGLLWFAGPQIFTAILPYALTLALFIVVVDLALLVFDLGDPPRFIHALRVLHFTSPLSVGVWGLACYTTCLALAVGIYWLSVISANGSDFLGPYLEFLDTLMKLFTVLSFIGAVVVICYKGVAFSCTSQPGVKDARWLTSYMVSDALLMGIGLYALLTFFLGYSEALPYLLVPTVVLLVARCVSFALLWMETKERARKVYSSENVFINVMVFLVTGLGGLMACFISPLGMLLTAVLVLINGLLTRYWIIGLSKKI